MTHLLFIAAAGLIAAAITLDQFFPVFGQDDREAE